MVTESGRLPTVAHAHVHDDNAEFAGFSRLQQSLSISAILSRKSEATDPIFDAPVTFYRLVKIVKTSEPRIQRSDSIVKVRSSPPWPARAAKRIPRARLPAPDGDRDKRIRGVDRQREGSEVQRPIGKRRLRSVHACQAGCGPKHESCRWARPGSTFGQARRESPARAWLPLASSSTPMRFNRAIAESHSTTVPHQTTNAGSPARIAWTESVADCWTRSGTSAEASQNRITGFRGPRRSGARHRSRASA